MLTRKKKKESATANFVKFLKANNCIYTTTKENSTQTFNFDFQAARFVASIRSQDDCLEITYPCMAHATISQLDLVRTKCNESNNSNILFKFSYSIDNEKNEVNVHMSFYNNHVDREQLVNELKAAFHFQREWHRDFDEAVALAKDNDTLDLECELYKHEHEIFMLRRLELRHQLGSMANSIDTGTGSLPLWQLLETVSPLPQALLLFMTVNTVSGQQRLDNTDEIRNFDLRHALVEGDGKQARLTRDYAVLDLHYK